MNVLVCTSHGVAWDVLGSVELAVCSNDRLANISEGKEIERLNHRDSCSQ